MVSLFQLQPQKPRRSPENRSLKRGIQILRAFNPGCEFLGNSELAEITGLSKPTISRLTQTLVTTGMLEFDPSQRAYRLSPAVLGLAHTMWTGSTLLTIATPLMTKWSDTHHLNVGLATADGSEMIYLDSIRYLPEISHRRIVRGQKIPMPTTSLGQAYLAVLDNTQRDNLIQLFQKRWMNKWSEISKCLNDAIEKVQSEGYCYANWLPGVVAVSTPILINQSIYALNCSTTINEPINFEALSFHKPLLTLRNQIIASVQQEIKNKPKFMPPY
ncbi:IclR family transcriptional regulator [Orrella sp. 11846]|uniref:IclR family transcriptional regulator n=1 Tax=Orrella sp. 11846 TaxID=3409913 RepID=UPI003B5AB7B3